jgi:hypothetical protein
MNPWDEHDLAHESYEDGTGYTEPVDMHSMLDYRNKAEYYCNLARELVDENNALRLERDQYINAMEELNAKTKAEIAEANAKIMQQLAAVIKERDLLIDRNELLSVRIQIIEKNNSQ